MRGSSAEMAWLPRSAECAGRARSNPTSAGGNTSAARRTTNLLSSKAQSAGITMSTTANTHAIGPYSKPGPLARLDQRTKEAKLMQGTRAELTAHVGGSPSVTERALIEMAVQLNLRIAAMDRKYAETGAMTELDTRTYLAWVNSLSRLLLRLGLKATVADHRSPSLSEIIAGEG